ncbi:MAG: nuclear transport factor 2 family protein [Paracoccaceae bacterium]
MRTVASSIVHIDDDRFKVTEWRFAPGSETGWHRHGHDYVIVPLTNGRLVLDLPGGAVAEAQLTQGVPYSRREGVKHNVINGSDSQPLSFLEVEVVDDALAHRRRDTMVAMMAAFNARDVEAVMACMATDCAFHASAGVEAEGQRHVGREAVRQATEAVFATFPEAAWTEGKHMVAGDTGLSSWRFVGRKADGTQVDVRGCDVLSFDGNKIAVKDSYRKART